MMCTSITSGRADNSNPLALVLVSPLLAPCCRRRALAPHRCPLRLPTASPPPLPTAPFLPTTPSSLQHLTPGVRPESVSQKSPFLSPATSFWAMDELDLRAPVLDLRAPALDLATEGAGRGVDPAVCRSEILEWEAHTTAVGRAVMALLLEGLGLGEATLEEASCLEGKVMVCHYYPVSPEPDRTMGLVPHTDPGVLTFLAQDGVGGLQDRYHRQQICQKGL